MGQTARRMSLASAVCAQHPSAPAAFTCSRCGTFACDACRSAPHEGLCPGCAQRIKPALQVSVCLQEGFHLLTRDVRVLGATALAYALLSLATMRWSLAMQPAPGVDPLEQMSTMLSAMGVTSAVGVLFGSAVYAVLLQYFGDVLERRERPAGEWVKAGLQRLPAMLGVNLAYVGMLLLGLLMCLVPGIILGVGFILAFPAVVMGRLGPVDSLFRSWDLSRERRLSLLLLLGVSTLPMMAFVVTGSLVLPALRSVGVAAFAAGTVISQTTAGLGTAFFLAVIAAAFARLARVPRGT
jgi:hypothetical protein